MDAISVDTSSNDWSFGFKSIRVQAGDHVILDNISGSLKPGEVLALLRPFGSGKTTLLDSNSSRLHQGSKLKRTGEILLGSSPMAPVNAAFLGYTAYAEQVERGILNSLTV
ncbi:uncharacterized protein L969DRAFT_100260 [Mixia osmundae IAM 14324]|uniref:ABC transporter domain-containing protein n=1 Tax=Mixia osmundae (strain CBS 9802 / IAM 14324 / JCM 22182 / KY 12970) TaxID=764103 RepID=G7DV24_MIXOS|nr:uncharacterized protein L969DRAFT_100260 [Mixia osmundae IAM 14324]KEI36349.1 hypothetical protein L969DRAFT_100260 [Mixia osmundae IAM 14324]GAA94434.1 hypothetical protein E5Q_01086 [Mixia osmundae IAM 14324]